MKYNTKYYQELTKQVWVQGSIHRDLLAPTHQRENPPFPVGWNTSTCQTRYILHTLKSADMPYGFQSEKPKEEGPPFKVHDNIVYQAQCCLV
jgi:hypothetical protein